MKNVINHTPQPGMDAATKGMFAPQGVLLEMGEIIYRFASDTAGFGYHAGAWWIREKDYELILEKATRKQVDLGQQARWDLAVLQKWGSKMNIVVKARICGKQWAYTGLAKPQQEATPTGQMIRMFGNHSIKQLYLPGIVDGVGILTPHGREVLAVVGAYPIPSAPIY